MKFVWKTIIMQHLEVFPWCAMGAIQVLFKCQGNCLNSDRKGFQIFLTNILSLFVKFTIYQIVKILVNCKFLEHKSYNTTLYIRNISKSDARLKCQNYQIARCRCFAPAKLLFIWTFEDPSTSLYNLNILVYYLVWGAFTPMFSRVIMIIEQVG